jgi:hypothetical protein
LKFQILLLILIIFSFIYYNNEHFDSKITNITKEKCGDLCTKTYDCIGFAYNDKTKNCYLGNNPIVGLPDRSYHRDEYNSKFTFCNKPHPIRHNVDEMKVDAHKNNTIYLCKNGIKNFASFKYIIDNKINDLKYKTSPFNIEPYQLKTINWKRPLDPLLIRK